MRKLGLAIGAAALLATGSAQADVFKVMISGTGSNLFGLGAPSITGTLYIDGTVDSNNTSVYDLTGFDSGFTSTLTDSNSRSATSNGWSLVTTGSPAGVNANESCVTRPVAKCYLATAAQSFTNHLLITGSDTWLTTDGPGFELTAPSSTTGITVDGKSRVINGNTFLRLTVGSTALTTGFLEYPENAAGGIAVANTLEVLSISISDVTQPTLWTTLHPSTNNSSVPEPISIALLGTALVGLGAARRKTA